MMAMSFRNGVCDRWAWRKLFGGLLLAMVGCALWYWSRVAVLPAKGGLFFPIPVRIDVPSFAQSDPRWGKELLGPTQNTLGAEGCAVTSAAMVLGFYGVDTDPSRLNAFLTQYAGYTDRGWLYWEAAAEYVPGRVRHAYEDLPSYRLLDSNLWKGNPVIVRIRPAGRGTHFVVVVGKRGWEYLAQDPGAGGRVVPLSSFGSGIEALRFYEPL
jgi:hypothetical protein